MLRKNLKLSGRLIVHILVDIYTTSAITTKRLLKAISYLKADGIERVFTAVYSTYAL